MPGKFYPLEVMQLRTQELASSHSATHGRVRTGGTVNHQGWDLTAEPGTPCFAIADGFVLWIRNGGAYGQQLAIQFNVDGSAVSSIEPLLAFYAHLHPGSITVAEGAQVRAGQLIARTGTSGNASASAPHLHFELRTTSARRAGAGLTDRMDPGEVLGYQLYNSVAVRIGGTDVARRQSVRAGRPTPIAQ